MSNKIKFRISVIALTIFGVVFAWQATLHPNPGGDGPSEPPGHMILRLIGR